MPSTYGEAHNERAVRTVINQGWNILTAELNTQAAQAMIAARNPDLVIGGRAWEDWAIYMGGVGAPLARQILNAINEEGDLSALARVSFKNVDLVSVKYAQTEGSKLISNLMESQKETIREVMGKALQGQYTVDQAAKAIRNTLGLHPRWAQAVINQRERVLRSLLSEGMPANKASALADKRNATYAQRLVNKRALNVARTEIQTAQNLGRYATWTQMVGNGYLSQESQKEWSPGPGACDLCAAMAGETVRWNEVFSNGSTMPPAHVNCRCSAVLLPINTGSSLDAHPIDWLNDNPSYVSDEALVGIPNVSSIIKNLDYTGANHGS